MNVELKTLVPNKCFITTGHTKVSAEICEGALPGIALGSVEAGRPNATPIGNLIRIV
jgi:hypothetical protein